MDLANFINSWDICYKSSIEQIDIFKPELTSQWSEKQKQCFAKIFYHARGHFHDFLWYVGNHATDKETKDIILKNISEELNGSAKSHEQMYLEFAKSVGSDVSDEFVTEKNYIDEIKKFNHGHLEWLSNHDADERFVAFAAYERLDNIDYSYLLNLVQSLQVSGKGQIFFKVHASVEHFAPTENKLEHIWNSSDNKLKKSFEFIANHQIHMWKTISDYVTTTS
jgi:hypothetical protein